VKAGFDHIILVQIGPDQDYFFDLFQRELAPALRKAKKPDGQALAGAFKCR
jgi:hypothetical protein